MAAQTKAKQGTNAMQMSTLPITCQICLGKVRQPVLCPNCHVFCGACMDIWLTKNQRCPACRVPIDDTNPVRHIRGGLTLNQQEDEETVSSPELRKIRIDLLYKDYEEALDRLQGEVKFLKTENAVLKSRLSAEEGGSMKSGSTVGPGGAADNDRLLLLTHKLQDAQKLYDRVKQDMNKLKQENGQLKEENVKLSREISKLRDEVAHRSPHRYGRLTVATLESQLEAQGKENHRLTKALERSDLYIEELQHQLQSRPDVSKSHEMQASHNIARSSTLSNTDDRQLNSNLRDKYPSLTGGHDRERGVTSIAYDANRSGNVIGENHPAKRQLFTATESWNKEGSFGLSGGLEQVAHHRQLDSLNLEVRPTDIDRKYSMRPASSNFNYPESLSERERPESIMKKSPSKQSVFDTGDRMKSPSKKVQFNLRERKGSESSSFDLEAPSPLTPSSSIGKLSLDSEDASPVKTARRLPLPAEVLRQSYPASHLRDSASQLRDAEDAVSSRFSTSAPHSSRLFSTMSHNFDDHSTAKNLSKKLITGTNNKKLSDSEGFRLSEPNTPPSLSSPDKVLVHSGSRRGGKGKETKQKNSSFDLEGPSLDDTQTIQSELNDLDISMTPELSDCLKLLNRAEKKVHQSDSPRLGIHAGTVSMSLSSGKEPTHFAPNVVHAGMGVGGGEAMGLVTFPRTYMPGTTGTMSSWEHGFFSTLRVNPYKHTMSVPQPHCRTADGVHTGSQILASSGGGSWQGLGEGAVGRSTTQLDHYPVSLSRFSDLGSSQKEILSTTSVTGGQLPSRPSSVPPSLGAVHSSSTASFLPSHPPSLSTNIYSQPATATSSHTSYASRAAHLPGTAGQGGKLLSGVVHDDLAIGRGGRYVPPKSVSGNYSYVSNTSSVGDMDSKDSFIMPEPKKRLFDTDDEFELSSPSKTTKML